MARWSILALAGIGAGIMLGNMTASTRLGVGSDEPATYSHLSANPDALVRHSDTAPPCFDCADSYGVALRLRAHRDNRMSDEFRKLGAVDVDAPTTSEQDDDYRYGGRFPDPDPVAQDDAVTAAERDISSVAETPLLAPE